MQIALIGIGKIANYQMQAITHTPGIKLVDAHDLDPNKAEELPGSVQFHDDLEKLLKRSHADAFLVSTPTSTHFEVAMRVIESDRIAIVEKPLCTNQSEMDALLTAARTRKLPLYTAFHPAYGREVDWWREQREARNFDLGPLHGFDTCFADPYYHRRQADPRRGRQGRGLDRQRRQRPQRPVPPDRSRDHEAGRRSHDGDPVARAVPRCRGWESTASSQQGRTGFGMVDTNWTLGKNYKATRLRYENGIVELDHARELASLSMEGEEKLVFNLATNKPRLVNHYCGVFSDLTAMFSRGEDNTGLSEVLHRLLFAALSH